MWFMMSSRNMRAYLNMNAARLGPAQKLGPHSRKITARATAKGTTGGGGGGGGGGSGGEGGGIRGGEGERGGGTRNPAQHSVCARRQACGRADLQARARAQFGIGVIESWRKSGGSRSSAPITLPAMRTISMSGGIVEPAPAGMYDRTPRPSMIRRALLAEHVGRARLPIRAPTVAWPRTDRSPTATTQPPA